MIVGDLNEIFYSEYKLGGNLLILDRFKVLNSFKDNTEMRDIFFIGNRFG